MKSVGQPVEDGSYADAQMSFPSVPGFGAGSDYLVEESVQEKGVNSLSELGRLDGNLDKGDPNCSSLLNDSNFNEEIPLSPQPPTTDIGGETSEKGVDMSSTVLSDRCALVIMTLRCGPASFNVCVCQHIILMCVCQLT